MNLQAVALPASEHQGDEDHEDILINAFDTFPLGVVLYVMLTGQPPFVLEQEQFEEDLAPDSVSEHTSRCEMSMMQCCVYKMSG